MKNKTIQKKLMILVLTVSLSAGMMAGCGSSATSSTAASSVTTEASTEQSGTLTVQVTKVENGKVTATVGKLQTGSTAGTSSDQSSSESSTTTPPAAPPSNGSSESSSDSSKSTDTAQSSDSSNTTGNSQKTGGGTPPSGGSAPAGNPPSGGSAPSGGSTFVAGSDTVTFTVDDKTAITVEYQQGSSDGTMDSITVNSVLEVTLGDDEVATSVVVKNLQKGSGFGGSDTVTNGTAATTIDSETEVSNKTYESSGDDENALRVDGATATLDGITVNKTAGSSSNTENGDFYGSNAGLLALNGANVTIKNATINTSAQNGNGVFSYGEGTTVNISDSKIRTTANNSGGIQTTGGGTTNATNLDVETEGNSAASIRSDRGGGTVKVDGGSYVTNGTGSPSIYSTANISVSNATLTANNSEGVVVEGQNSVTLKDCNLTGNMKGNDDSDNLQAVMIYQSMSGDAEVGSASFSATGGSITSKSGDLFYVTNTTTTINLSDVDLTLANDVLLRDTGNSSSRGWGTEGANGGKVTMTADNQKLTGQIIVDKISTLNLSMKNGTTYTGAINQDGAAGDVTVTLDSSSTWTLSADSYVTTFNGDVSNINANGHTLYVNGTAVTK